VRTLAVNAPLAGWDESLVAMADAGERAQV
jgi:hypothetical protein